jgi:hypothetical protein
MLANLRRRLAAGVLLGALIALAAAPAGAARPIEGFSPDDGRVLGPLVVPSLGTAVPPGGSTAPAGGSGPFRMDLAQPGDFVAQKNFVQCVGASVQMMLNISRPGADRSAATQQRLQRLARARSGPAPGGFVRQGAGVFGWSAALSAVGSEGYEVIGTRTLGAAMRQAAIAIRTRNRPVGLLVWRGRHAWVMSGFVATADPALTDDFRVTRAFILDPLYPHGSAAWGASPRPGRSISVATVGQQFVRRRSSSPWNRLPGMARLAGRYVLVVPAAPGSTVSAQALPAPVASAP